MPYRHFTTDEKSIPQAFKEYIEYIYDGNCMIDSIDENEAYFSMNVPGELRREDFENDVQDFCEEHNCSFELINQTPEAPSPQYFSENLKLMYPRVKNFEALKKQDRKFQVAKELWKKNWGTVEFNEEDPDDQEDIVLLYNEYMEELAEWKPVELKLTFNKLTDDSEENEEDIDYDTFEEQVFQLLEDRFLNKEVEVQVAGGGSGPDEWYEEDDVEIEEIEFDYPYIIFHLRKPYTWSVSKGDVDYDITKTYTGKAEIYIDELNIPENLNYKQKLEFIKQIPDRRFKDLIYQNAEGDLS